VELPCGHTASNVPCCKYVPSTVDGFLGFSGSSKECGSSAAVLVGRLLDPVDLTGHPAGHNTHVDELPQQPLQGHLRQE
jgi:hypothetical protein